MNSQVISFRASGHFLSWIESQRLEGESANQAAQRILKEISGVSTPSVNRLSTLPANVSTINSQDVVSTEIVDIVDKAVSSSLDPVMERMAAIEERLGKLRA